MWAHATADWHDGSLDQLSSYLSGLKLLWERAWTLIYPDRVFPSSLLQLSFAMPECSATRPGAGERCRCAQRSLHCAMHCLAVLPCCEAARSLCRWRHRARVEEFVGSFRSDGPWLCVRRGCPCRIRFEDGLAQLEDEDTEEALRWWGGVSVCGRGGGGVKGCTSRRRTPAWRRRSRCFQSDNQYLGMSLATNYLEGHGAASGGGGAAEKGHASPLLFRASLFAMPQAPVAPLIPELPPRSRAAPSTRLSGDPQKRQAEAPEAADRGSRRPLRSLEMSRSLVSSDSDLPLLASAACGLAGAWRCL